MSLSYFTAPVIFDGETEHSNSALAINNGRVVSIVPANDVAANAYSTRFDTGMIAPGFVDLQVNGGGGVMLGDNPSVATIERICAAHRSFGSTSLLPTLITDTPEQTRATIAAGIEATKRGVPGFRGLHLEGPHLSKSRKGTHDPALIRPMTENDLATLLMAKNGLETLFVTVAPESASVAQVQTLAKAGVIVSLGHSDADYETALKYVDAGASCATHLFNAMSQLGSREPGLVGAVLSSGRLHAGLIADGFHVHNASMKAALGAKNGPARIHLVTDAMSTVGSDIQSFMLNSREIRRSGGRLTLADGTLAGADIDMMSCVRSAHGKLGLSITEALRMAGLYPAICLGREDEIGVLKPGSRADFVQVSDRLDIGKTYVGGFA